MTSTATTDLAPDAQTLTQIVDDVFAGLVGQQVDVQACPEPALPLTAFVSVSGEWQASVVFACSERLARTVASMLFGIATDDVDESDLCDVIGEVVNVIGGNVKSVMPGPSVLSLPHASLAGEWHPPSPAVELVVHLELQGEPMRISVWSDHRQPGASISAKEARP